MPNMPSTAAIYQNISMPLPKGKKVQIRAVSGLTSMVAHLPILRALPSRLEYFLSLPRSFTP